MAKVKCFISTDYTENDNGNEVICTFAVCDKCGHETMSYGDHEGSVKRCLALMREECPRNENNFYIEAYDESI